MAAATPRRFPSSGGLGATGRSQRRCPPRRGEKGPRGRARPGAGAGKGWREPRGRPREPRGDGLDETPGSRGGRRSPGGGGCAGEGLGAPAAPGGAPTCAATVPGDHGLSGERVQPGRALRLLAAGTDTRTESGRRSPGRPLRTPLPAPPPAQPSPAPLLAGPPLT